MKKEYIILFVWIVTFCGVTFFGFNVKAQSSNATTVNSDKTGKDSIETIDLGLRTIKSWRNTGATFTLSGEDLTKMISGNLLNTLQGRIPGLTVLSGSGEPGYDNPTFYLRGQSSWNIGGNKVLIYLDGFEVDMAIVAALSAFEIESVTLLKDASALAMYGLDGGAGVLVINTKVGKIMPKTKITLNGRRGMQSIIKLPTVMNAYDYTRLYNQALANDGLPQRYSNPELYKAGNDPMHPNVNWYDEMLKNTSVIQDYNLSFRGGSQTAKYYALMNYTDFSGIYKNADAVDKDFGTNAKYNKINLRANMELQLSKNLSIMANLTGITEDRNTPAGFTAFGLFDNLMRIPAAAFPVKNPNNTWGINSVYNFNPVQNLQQNGIYNSHSRNLQTSIRFKQKLDALVPGLDLVGGISFSNQYIGYYQKLFAVPAFEISKNDQDQPNLDPNGKVVYIQRGAASQSINEGEIAHWNRTTFQAGLNYSRSFQQQSITASILAKKQDYTHNGLIYPLRSQGLSGSVTYDYKEKYIVDVTAAYNGSADYQKGNRYGFFPSLGLGWILSKEDFLKTNQAIDYLKLRASYGSSGNVNESFRFLYEQWAVGSGGYTVGTGNSWKGGYAEGKIATPNPSWEEKTTFNFGVDATLWKNLMVTVDVFSENRTGILEYPSANVPGYTGFALPILNTGKVKNSGFEAILTYKKEAKIFSYYASGSAAFSRNKIVEKSETAQPFSYLYEQGYRLGQMRGLVYTGFYKENDFNAGGELKDGISRSSYTNVKPGDLKFKDQDGNGIINDYDKIPMNYASLPELTLGFNLGFKFKRFDFDAYLQGTLNRTINLLDQANIYTHPFVNNNNITVFSANSWTPETAGTATSPRLSTLNNANNNQSSDYWMRNGSFFKLRSIELGYTLPQTGILRNMDLVRIYASGTNLFTWDQLDDLEAERLSMGYPLMKTVSFGLRVKF